MRGAEGRQFDIAIPLQIQTARQLDGAVGLGKAGITFDRGQNDLRHNARMPYSQVRQEFRSPDR
jgi:hypothetical protein